MTVEELLAEMEALVARAREEQGGAMTDEQASRYEELERQLRALEKTQEIEKRHAAWTTPRRLHGAGAAAERSEESRAFSDWLRAGQPQVPAEIRALSKGTDAAGGYLVPDEWRDKLVECIRSFGGFINEAEQITTSDGRTLFWPTIDDGTNAAAITAEAAAFGGGADPTFGEGNLGAYKYTTTGAGNNPLKISVELLQDSMIDLDSKIRELFGRRIHRKQATDAVVGTGTGQPKGILNGTADFTLSTTNIWDQTNNGWEDLIDVEALLDPEYLDNAKWLMNRATYAQIRKLKDTNGRPLIGTSTDGINNAVGGLTLMGYPVILDQAAPNAADNTNFMAFGDFRQAYVWRTVADLQVIQDPYTSKSTGQVEYVAWQRGSGTVQNRCAYVIIGGKTA